MHDSRQRQCLAHEGYGSGRADTAPFRRDRAERTCQRAARAASLAGGPVIAQRSVRAPAGIGGSDPARGAPGRPRDANGVARIQDKRPTTPHWIACRTRGLMGRRGDQGGVGDPFNPAEWAQVNTGDANFCQPTGPSVFSTDATCQAAAATRCRRLTSTMPTATSTIATIKLGEMRSFSQNAPNSNANTGVRNANTDSLVAG